MRNGLGRMNGPVGKLARCAIYTRKSSEHNLDLAFSSLDAQREACEAYIKSQSHEGWRLIPGRYDAGAFSGASLERELIGERVRDKIAASKRKGIWVGGPVPLGYAAVDKKIVVVPAEAEVVRTIFARYLELGSVRALAEDLDRRGIRTTPRQLSDGRTIGGVRFGVGALAHLLKNRFYVGEVVYRGAVHRGEHEPIIDSALFAAVQDKLAAPAVARRSRLRGPPA